MSSTAKGKSSKRSTKGLGTFKTPLALGGQKRLILAISVVYIVSWFVYVNQSPMGNYPTAPEREIITQAIEISTGVSQLTEVPLYTGILSLAAKLIPTVEHLYVCARLLNVAALIATVALCFNTSGKYWNSKRAMWITGLLVGLNPILVFWSTTISPTILATLCLAVAFSQTVSWLRTSSRRKSLIIGSLLSGAFLFQVGILPMLIVWIVACWIYPSHNKLQHLATGVVGPAIALVVLALSPISFAQPIQIDTAGLGYSSYAFFNSAESYDGKSYVLHGQIHTLLQLNPLHWGILLISGVTGAYLRFKWGLERRSLYILAIAFFSIGVSYIFLGGASQMRSTLYPIFGILAGGLMLFPSVWKRARKKTKISFMSGLAILSIATYTSLFGIRSEKTWEDDYAYLAEAYLAGGQKTQAADWALNTLEINPDRSEMHGIITRASFDQWALIPNPRPLTVEVCDKLFAESQLATVGDAEVQAIQALYQFKLRSTDEAVEQWRTLKEKSALAHAFLFWTGNASSPNSEDLESLSASPYIEVLQEAVSINRNSVKYSDSQKMMDNLLAFAF